MASDDFFDGALDEFEALTSSLSAVSPTQHASQAKPTDHSDTSTADIPTMVSASSTAPMSKAPAFDPLKKGNKKTAARAASTAVPAPAAPAPAPATSTMDKSSISPPSAAQLPPELQQLADDLAKLISESSLDVTDSQPSTSSPANAHAPTGPQGGPQAAGTMASLQALEQLTQRSVAAQGSLPGASAGASAGGGMFGGMLPNLEGLGEPHMNSIVDSIMQHLLSKEVLYQPMKDIRDCYPPWLASNKGVVPEADMERYVRQYGFIQQICKLYEEEPGNYSQLVTLMQQMQACGDPPEAIVREMSAGLDHIPPEADQAGEGEGEGPPLGDLDLQQLQNEINKCPVQ